MAARRTRSAARTWGRVVAGAAGAVGAAASLTVAAPADAAIVVDSEESFVLTPPDLECAAPDGSTFTLTRSMTGVQTLRFKTRAAGSVETYLELRYADQLTFTNTTTGISFTAVRDGQDKDSALVERLDDGQYVVLTTATGRTTFYAPDGSRAGVQVGVERYRTLLDSQGTADPSDDEFVGGELLLGAGNPGTSICDFAVELTRG